MNDRMDIVYHYCSAEIFFWYNKNVTLWLSDIEGG